MARIFIVVTSSFDLIQPHLLRILLQLRFAVLNDPTLPSGSKIAQERSKEVEVENALADFTKTLHSYRQGRVQEAKQSLESLLALDFMNDALPPTPDIQGSHIHAIQYLVRKNYAAILESEGRKQEAADYLAHALTIDPTDVTTCCKLATLAKDLKDLELAQFAYEEAVRHANGYQKLSCLRDLSEVLYDRGDYSECLRRVKQVLKVESFWARGIWLKHDIVSSFVQSAQQSHALESSLDASDIVEFHNYPNTAMDELIAKHPEIARPRNAIIPTNTPIERKAYVLDELSWNTLGRLLLQILEERIKLSPNLHTMVGGPIVIELAPEIAVISPIVIDDDVPPPPIVINQMPPDPDVMIVGEDDTSDIMSAMQDGATVSGGEQKRRRTTTTGDEDRRKSRRMKEKTVLNEPSEISVDDEMKDALERWLPKPWTIYGLSDDITPSPVPDPDVYVSRVGGKLGALFPMDFAFSGRATPASISTNDDPYFGSTAPIRDFLAHIPRNADILDIMRQFVIHLIVEPAFSTRAWPVELRTTIFETICKVEEHSSLLSYIRNSYPILWWSDADVMEVESVEWNDSMVLKIFLTVGELALDALPPAPRIDSGRKVIPAPQLAVPATGRGRQRADKIGKDGPVAPASVSVFHNTLAYLIALNSRIFADQSIESDIVVRYLCFLGRAEERAGRNEAALNSYELCLDLLDEGDDVSLLHSTSLSHINKATILTKIRAIRSQSHVWQALRDYEAKDYAAVARRLVPILLFEPEQGTTVEPVTNHIDEQESLEHDVVSNAMKYVRAECTFEQRFKLYHILERSLFKIGQNGDGLMCLMRALIDTVRNIEQIDASNEAMNADKLTMILGQIIRFFETHSLSDTLLLFASSSNVTYKSWSFTMTKQVLCTFLSSIFLLLRLSWYVAKHEIEILSSSTARNQPRKEAMKLFLTHIWHFSIDLWTFLYTDEGRRFTNLLGAVEPASVASSQNISEDLSTSDDSRDPLAEVMKVMHDLLGLHGICCLDDAALMRSSMAHFKSLTKLNLYERELYQIFYCLYGVLIQVEQDANIDEHATIPKTFGREAASECFDILSEHLMRKLFNGGTNLRTSIEVRANLQQIADAIGPLPQNVRLLLNREAIDKYLTSDIDVSAISFGRSSSLYVWDIEEKSMSHVHFTIHGLQGKLAWSQHKGKQQKHKRGSEFLGICSAEFLINLQLNPHSRDAWICLGQTFAAESYEALAWSAKEIIEHRKNIADLQKANHIRLKMKRDTSHQNSYSPWGELSFLIDSIISQPMSGYALRSQSLRVNKIWADREKAVLGTGLQQRDISPPRLVSGDFEDHLQSSRAALLRVAVWTLRKRMHEEPIEWHWPFLMGKMYEKLGKDFDETFAWYERALQLVPEEWTTKDQEHILDVKVKFLSYLAKSLHKGLITPEAVWEKLALLGVTKTTEAEPISPTHSDDARSEAFYKLCTQLRLIKLMDKKRWQHKPYYRLAWILYHAFHDVQAARAEISILFAVKSKSYINFWRSEFERPGKHYVYAEKYTIFFIQLLDETEDYETLLLLAKKIRKADDTLLTWNKVFALAFNACLKGMKKQAINFTFGPTIVGRIKNADLERNSAVLQTEVFKVLENPTTREAATDFALLVKCFELRKANDRAVDDSELEEIMFGLYSKIYDNFMATSPAASVVDQIGVPAAAGEGKPVTAAAVMKKITLLCRNPPKAVNPQAPAEPEPAEADENTRQEEGPAGGEQQEDSTAARVDHEGDVEMGKQDDIKPDSPTREEHTATSQPTVLKSSRLAAKREASKKL
ncbi:hypothetical protein SmJEL517_g02284 [Synchytrium microbalum]|uniref:Histone transcription regulator 3 homolog n=1 Tax=Synchytrium microbalum TaxID=1806994 RepID=A0A507CCI6_9FUNG|nr:uncharacterized protein SmJEL517_g02284 [Synchytrium microbalum]TPX35253.1 hypothetical protein SmJEL517_g02284 [Synchytrium microbalum]